jgi:LmbE family N-acetylglucosaminyl deacetylase
MHALTLSPGSLRLLCLGAHADDLEIGCGGTILQFIEGSKTVDVDWVVFSARGVRAREARAGARLFLERARRKQVAIKRFRDGFFPYQGVRIKQVFEELKRRPAPDLIFTHYRHDLHQDHRLLSDLTWQTFRNHWILEYEIPKFDGDLGTPNLFVPLDKATCARKVAALQAAFRSQRPKPWFSDDTFRGLMRLRGMECRAPHGYAEAFHVRKLVLAP